MEHDTSLYKHENTWNKCGGVINSEGLCQVPKQRRKKKKWAEQVGNLKKRSYEGLKC
jgi:hypothetical protein